MLKCVIVFTVIIYGFHVVLSGKFDDHIKVGRKFEPTKGEVWPKLKEQRKQTHFLVLRDMNFSITRIGGEDCLLIRHAESRFKNLLSRLYSFADPKAMRKDPYNKGYFQELQLIISEPCPNKPPPSMQEYYELNVSATTVIGSNTVWGVMRGLESLSQMFYIHERMLIIHENEVIDYPEFEHRGLMLDTSRHFISVEKIFTIIEAMAMNKMNVFHWHIVDDESFPFHSQKFPELSMRGAFCQNMVYDAYAISEVIRFAMIRGIRVIPEFNMPGHTRAISKSHAEILTECIDPTKLDPEPGPLRPFGDQIYDFLSDLLYEIEATFIDDFIHLGGTDVNVKCWKSSQDVHKTFMEVQKTLKIELGYDDLPIFFTTMVLNILNERNNMGTKIIVWQDIVDMIKTPTILYTFENSSLYVQVYKKPIPLVTQETQYKVIYSVPWDLSNLNNTFSLMYANPPSKWGTPVTCGGEALLWTHNIDDTNVITSIWSRAAAAAEVLWNMEPIKSSADIPPSVYERLEEHTCRMVKLGIPAESVSGPGYCDN